MAAKRFTVLITDQDKDFLLIADKKLSDRGFNVITSFSAQSSIRILKSCEVDYLLAMNVDDKEALEDFINSMGKKPVLMDENFHSLEIQPPPIN